MLTELIEVFPEAFITIILPQLPASDFISFFKTCKSSRDIIIAYIGHGRVKHGDILEGDDQYKYINGQLHGLSVYHDGPTTYRSHYVNDLLHGVCECSRPDGFHQELKFVRGNAHGPCTITIPNRDIVKTYSYENDKKHGKYLIFTHGKLNSRRYYTHGVKDKRWIKYHPDGSVKEQVDFKDGLYHGEFEIYNEHHKLKYSGKFKAGEKDGTWCAYSETSDVITTELTYKNGLLYGQVTTRDAMTGLMTSLTNMKDGLRDGWALKYSNGKLIGQNYYCSGTYVPEPVTYVTPPVERKEQP